ncbi:hypothetical protein [Azospirillum sp. TSO35-2]|uniref:hypothetical protein n=1 Tax=Azospirillum sp. TSO35-2 TaxID=716796 RepID=UPI000D6168CD|nr:hypothetical protein [Azospirillum sp. TSO35-2]PWC36638.1 hypothetical protein TSO352_14575 [Azospirillum sp. TSO35-2]
MHRFVFAVLPARRTALALVAAALLVTAGARSAAAQSTAGQPAAPVVTPFSFGLWGDLPYAKNGDGPKMKRLIDNMNEADIAFSMFDGDTKDGSSECTDGSYADAVALFDQLKRPMIYVPGDNEWTDCHRLNNGGYDNLERLAHVRKTLFATNQSYGQAKLTLEQQGKPGEAFSENTRLIHNGIVFVGLNIPGSNNNKVFDEKDCTRKSARKAEQCAADNAEYEERDAANIAWMKEALAKAKAIGAPGVVLTFQADLGFDLPETEGVDERKTPGYDGYDRFIDALVAEARGYDGQILIVHGDTHFFKVDKPLVNQANLIANVTRVETFGSPNAHWVKVDVDPAARELFVVHPMIVPGN